MRDAYDNYLAHCIKDSLSRNEAPYAPHAFLHKYLSDTTRDTRQRALDIGLKYLVVCQLLAIYSDYGISEGMQNEMDYAKANNVPINIRKLF